MATDNTTALHYLELLNTIASGERRAGVRLGRRDAGRQGHGSGAS